ncbi:unnamed protein product [Dibothriocephalus latus]|uniref:Fibronectin type-III domain-containing protein n=1 Tax=Dibothriocephalus latus TaxID=60516 RepID=A0A3P6QG39_DIBLA|nr:unnamed protein product [Dibothriocephalus latus]
MPACAMPVPRNLNVSIVDSKDMRVTWLPPSDASQCGNQYEVIVRNATYQDKIMVTKTEYILPNINPSSKYIITIHATDKDNKPFAASASITVKMAISEMPVPRNLTASIVDVKNIRVTWLPPLDTGKCGDKYLVIVRNATYQNKAMVTQLEYTLTNANPSSVYTITIHATDKKDRPYPASASISVQIKIAVVPTVGDLTASQVNDTTIIVTWTKPVPVEKFKDEYHITIYGEGTKETYTTKETWIIASGWDITSIYNITVQGVWANGTLVPDVATTYPEKPSLGVPVVPRGFTAAILNCTTIRLTWKIPSNTKGWEGKYLLTVTSSTSTKNYTLERTEETLFNLQLSSVYNFTLQALSGCCKPFPAAAFITAKTSACDIPVPRDLIASPVNSTSIRITWKASEDTSDTGDQYMVTVRNATYETQDLVKNTQYVISNLNPSSVYNFTVRATDKKGRPFSASASITVKISVQGKLQLSSMRFFLVFLYSTNKKGNRKR